MKKSHLTLKIFFLIILNDLSDTVAQLIMKRGLIYTTIDSVNLAGIAEFVIRNASSILLWMGLLLYTLNFFIWIIILYKVDLSIAMPVGSISYVLVPVAAMVFLHEHVGLLRWLGIAFIMLGVHFVSRSKKEIVEGS